MSIKSDRWIKKMVKKHRMIEPFEEKQIKKGIISYGLSSYGYDMRLSDEFKIFRIESNKIIDPKNIGDENFISFKGRVCLVPENSYVLGRSLEYFRIPRNILTICVGKSTYARCGVIVNVTPFEPEWEGYATIGISNTSPSPVKLYAGEGVAQVIFLESTKSCEISYADKKGKYQKQRKITIPRI